MILYAYYGDDFTGSTDVLEQLAQAGVPAVLFLQPPSDAHLARFPGLQALGIAGDSRSRPPEWMREHLPAIFARLQALTPRIVHYKTCSTFDSAPHRGSIGAALEIGRDAFPGRPSPIVVGAPHLKRYVAFATLFAAAGGEEAFRIDRHPTMSRHPATPMHEADLRRHLADQTALPIALVDLAALHTPVAEIALAGEAPVMFDGVSEADLARTGALVWAEAARAPLFGVGSSGLTRALISAWRAGDAIGAPAPLAHAEPVGPFLVVSGSCSPVTERQIGWALARGYRDLYAAPERLLDPVSGEAHARKLVDDALAALAQGAPALIYSARGATDPTGVDGEALARRQGAMLAEIVERSGVRRVLVAGGDTSSHAIQQLDIYALTFTAGTEPGAPLCRVHSDGPAFDGLQLVLKGGQMGSEDFFDVVRRGGPSR
jgi:3-oxoisoapionate kinase